MDIDRVSKAVVDRAIEQASARVRTVSALAGALLICAAALGYVAFAVLADHVVDGGLPLMARRVALGIVGLLAVILTATYVVRPAFRRINQLYAAWLLERARPDLRHSVTTSLLLRHRSDVHVGVSSGLAFQAARAVRRMDITGVVSDRALRRAGLAVCVVLAAFCVYGVFAPKQVRPSVLRVLGADIAAPTQTSVEIIAPALEASVVVGTPVDFEVALTGRAPDRAWVEFSHDEGRSWSAGQRLDLNRPTDRSAAHQVWTATKSASDVGATVWYRVRAGDARCETRRLEVRPQPVVAEHVVSVAWPDYANRSGFTRTEGPIDALIGSRAELTVRTNVPASNARVVFHGASGSFSRQMSINDADSRTLQAAWVVDRNLEYEVRFDDLHGAENPNPIRYSQRARGDRPPEIVQSDPPARFTASQSDVFAVKARITDDWGLGKVTLEYRSTRGSGRIDLAGKLHAGPTVLDVSESISVASLGALEGDVVEMHLEAGDTRLNLRGKPDPQITRGPVCELRVVGGKGTSGGNGPQIDADRKRGATPSGNQLAGKGDSGDQGGSAGQSDDTGNAPDGKRGGNESDDAAIARADKDGQPDPSKEAEGEKQPTQPNEASQQGQPGGEGSPSDAGEKGAEGDPAKSNDPGSVAKGDSSKGGKSETGAGDDATDAPSKDGKPNEKGNAETGATNGEPNDAASELDRLIEDNKDALERLGQSQRQKPPEDSANKAAEPSKPEAEPKSPEVPKPSEPDKSANPPESTKKSDGTDKTTARKPSAEKQESDNDTSKDAAKQSGDKSDPNANDAEKPGESQSSKKDSKSEKKAETGASAKSGDESSDKAKPSNKHEQAQSEKGKSSPDNEGDAADGKTNAGSTKNPHASEAGKPAKESGGNSDKPAKPGEPEAGHGGDATDGHPTETQSDGKPKSVTSAKQTGDNNSAKSGEKDTSTPQPAQGVGPTPKSGGGGVAPDEGPSESDGQFEGKGESDSLGAPMRERAHRAVDELERRLRDGGVSDAELRDLGWSRADAQSFVTRYRRLQTAAQRQRDGGLFSGRTRQSDDDVKAIGGASATGVGRGVAGAIRNDRGTAKDAGGLREGPAESVPTELQDVLDEYYRSMARQGEPKAKTDK